LNQVHYKMLNSKLIGKIVPVYELTTKEKERMYNLMSENYDGVSINSFEKDLSEKADAILLSDNESNQIHGFSTLMILEERVRGVKTKVLFSGDTIIDKKYWGDTELEHHWGKYAFSLIDKNPNMPLFWFLMSKGYKTYKFLPVFFNEFYPRHDKLTPDYEQEILDTFAKKKYPLGYNPLTGLVKIEGNKDRLKQGVADIDERRLKDPHIRYFLQKNPHWFKGDELCCIMPLKKDNFNKMALRVIGHNKS
jgi:hypothetical protein